jgi:hypothetical protein
MFGEGPNDMDSYCVSAMRDDKQNTCWKQCV